MSDMLVKLYELPEVAPLLADLARRGIEIRPAQPFEKRFLGDWVRERFSDATAAQCEAAVEQRPITCYVAVERQAGISGRANPYDLPAETLIGFACYDVAARGMFGPEGVREDRRGHGIGRGLLLACLHAMRADRYAYAVIGWAGPPGFYTRTVGATPIDGSEPGIYRGLLVSR